MNDNDKLLMALDEAKKAYELDEIPVGCVIFREDEIVNQDNSEAMLKNAPEQEMGCYKVPKTVN